MRLFNGLTIIIILLLLTSTSIFALDLECSDTNPMCFENKLMYQPHSKYDTPFNPNRVLDDWKVIMQEVLPGTSIPLIIMGHPYINWEKVPKDIDPGLAIRPEGVNYAAIFFTFSRVPGPDGDLKTGTNEIILISYRDPVNGTNITHRLCKDKNGYELMSEQMEKTYNERKSAPMNVNYYIMNSFN